MEMEDKRKRKRQTSSDESKKNRKLMDLPTEILLEIFSRLAAKSVCCVKCSSETLFSMVNNLSFRTLHTRRLQIASVAAATRLMACSFDRYAGTATMQSLTYKKKTLTKGSFAITVGSLFHCFVFRNVFCLGSKEGDYMLINPLEGERGRALRLPKTNFARDCSDCWSGMGYDDKTNSYKILCITPEPMTVHVLVLGSNFWREISSLPPCDDYWKLKANKSIGTNGALHRLSSDRRILSFDFKREEFSWTPTPRTLRTLKANHLDEDMKLLTVKGCLGIVDPEYYSSRGGADINIWMLKDFDNKSWVRYYRYTDRIIEGCLSNLFWFKGIPGEWEHGIFFIRHKLFDYVVSFVDFRDGSVEHVVYNVDTTYWFPEENIYGYPETLISLKDYGHLEQLDETPPPQTNGSNSNK